jgi:hypothetical protein
MKVAAVLNVPEVEPPAEAADPEVAPAPAHPHYAVSIAFDGVTPPNACHITVHDEPQGAHLYGPADAGDFVAVHFLVASGPGGAERAQALIDGSRNDGLVGRVAVFPNPVQADLLLADVIRWVHHLIGTAGHRVYIVAGASDETGGDLGMGVAKTFTVGDGYFVHLVPDAEPVNLTNTEPPAGETGDQVGETKPTTDGTEPPEGSTEPTEDAEALRAASFGEPATPEPPLEPVRPFPRRGRHQEPGDPPASA